MKIRILVNDEDMYVLWVPIYISI